MLSFETSTELHKRSFHQSVCDALEDKHTRGVESGVSTMSLCDVDTQLPHLCSLSPPAACAIHLFSQAGDQRAHEPTGVFHGRLSREVLWCV